MKNAITYVGRNAHKRDIYVALEARLAELDAALHEVAQTEPYREPVAWLRCFRGIDTLTAVIIVAELHDFRRFHSARALMASLGLVPSGHSSGEHARRGRITEAGNAFVRRVLIEAAWHYQHRPWGRPRVTRAPEGPARSRDCQCGPYSPPDEPLSCVRCFAHAE
jgi:transposase